MRAQTNHDLQTFAKEECVTVAETILSVLLNAISFVLLLQVEGNFSISVQSVCSTDHLVCATERGGVTQLEFGDVIAVFLGYDNASAIQE